jgi:hypothetical protein
MKSDILLKQTLSVKAQLDEAVREDAEVRKRIDAARRSRSRNKDTILLDLEEDLKRSASAIEVLRAQLQERRALYQAALQEEVRTVKLRDPASKAQVSEEVVRLQEAAREAIKTLQAKSKAHGEVLSKIHAQEAMVTSEDGDDLPVAEDVWEDVQKKLRTLYQDLSVTQEELDAAQAAYADVQARLKQAIHDQGVS